MKLALLLIAVLLAGTLQCVAGCAMITGDAPCHHDQQSPSACAHELVLQTPQAVLPATAPDVFQSFIAADDMPQVIEPYVPLIPHVTSPPLRV